MLIRNKQYTNALFNGGSVGIGTSSPQTTLDVNGVINSATGYKIANGAALGNYLRGNGTNFVSSPIFASDLPPLDNLAILNQSAIDQSAQFRITSVGLTTALITSSSAATGTKVLSVTNPTVTTNAITGISSTVASTSASSSAVFGSLTSGTAGGAGVWGEINSNVNFACGVYGESKNATAGRTHAIYGKNQGGGTDASAVYGVSLGTTSKNYGVWGYASSTIAGSAGVYGAHANTTAAVNGVMGLVTSTNTLAKDNTPDGTCIRDFIHLQDLCEAHIKVLEYMLNGNSIEDKILNIGTGTGYSIKQITEVFKGIKYKLKTTSVDRRLGDVVSIYADTTKATRLGITCKATIEDCVKSHLNFYK